MYLSKSNIWLFLRFILWKNLAEDGGDWEDDDIEGLLDADFSDKIRKEEEQEGTEYREKTRIKKLSEYEQKW